MLYVVISDNTPMEFASFNDAMKWLVRKAGEYEATWFDYPATKEILIGCLIGSNSFRIMKR